jgi:dipeptidyl aminopeptidase/acylaminoacyl peptidase
VISERTLDKIDCTVRRYTIMALATSNRKILADRHIAGVVTELSISDVLDVEYPGPPAWASDGKYLASAVYEDDGQAVQFATADGDPQWRYRPDDAHVSAFAWRPDRHECLIATDDERTMLVDPRAETVQTLVAADEAEHTWSNDGDQVACYRDGTPWVLEVGTGETTAFDVPDRGPYLAEERMFAWSEDDSLLAYRFVDHNAKQVGVVDVETGDLVYRTDSPASSRIPAWFSGDRLLLDRVDDRATRRELVVVNPHDGVETVVVNEEDPELGVVSRGVPEVAPTGDRFVVPLPLDGWDHLYLVDESGPEQLTEGAFEDKGVADSTPRWLKDDVLVFSSNRLAPEQRGIYAVNADTGSVRPIVETPGTNVYPAPSPDGERLAFVHADTEHSPEVRVRDLNADPLSAGRRVTESAVDDWPTDPVEPERMTLGTDDGFEIPAFVVDPRDTDAVADDATDLPAVVWVHGGPMRQMRHGWHPGRAYGLAYTTHQYLARQGYVGLMVNYRGGIGYGKTFRQAIAADPGAEVDVDVVAAAEYLKGLNHVDADAVAIWGLSYGGFAALRVLGTEPGAYGLGVNLAGVADRRVYEEWATETKYSPAESSLPTTLGGTRWETPSAWAEVSPVTHMENYEAPLYSFHGTTDRYVNVEQLGVVVDELLDLDADFEYEYYPDETHVFSKRCVWERVLGRIETAFETEL